MSDTTATTKYNKYAVLYVDDEEQALKYFQKGLGRDFQVMIATNVAAAMEILKKDAAKIGVVVSDQRMPGGSGTELLTNIRRQWPNIVRIMTTAYSDMESAIAAVNAGQIFKYLTKPVDFNLMRETLKQAMDEFLARGERDSFLQIKMSDLRRLVVADRVGSLANMAYGMSQHLRNSMTAMSCFLEEADPANSEAQALAAAATAAGNGATGAQDYAKQLWSLAAAERDRLIQMLESVQRTAVDPVCQFGNETDPEQVIKRAAEAAAKEIEPKTVTADVAPGLSKLKVDADKVAQLIKTLTAYIARHSGNQATRVTIAAKTTVQLWNATALQVLVRGEGPAWTDQDVATFFTPFAFPKDDPSELGLNLLSAFSIAHQHGGDLLVHRDAPNGPGFELLLPLDPSQVARPELQENLVQRIFA
jgi:two-component system probable response regulator PhcQ